MACVRMCSGTGFPAGADPAYSAWQVTITFTPLNSHLPLRTAPVEEEEGERGTPSVRCTAPRGATRRRPRCSHHNLLGATRRLGARTMLPERPRGRGGVLHSAVSKKTQRKPNADAVDAGEQNALWLKVDPPRQSGEACWTLWAPHSAGWHGWSGLAGPRRLLL